ncbi:hypothetical protein [Halosimplex marinum]|uniref:hypothetical protein n=1 Tax=Halosimplex marinum TaxID=3396620 RepID=UPI003F56084F
MATDPGPPDDAADDSTGEYPADPTDLAGASDADLAALVAEAWTADGYRTTVREHGSHVFVFAKRRVDGGISGEIVWIAGERAVESAQLEQLRALAKKTGADSAVCLTVGAGGVARSVAAGHDVTVVDGDDLRSKLGVDGPSDAGTDPDATADGPAVDAGGGDGGLAPPGGEMAGDSIGDTSTGDAASTGATGTEPDDAESGYDLGDAESDDGSDGIGAGSGGFVDGASGIGGGSDGIGDEGDGAGGESGAAGGGGPSNGRPHLDAWDGRTAEADVTAPPFDGLWAAVTRDDAVESVGDRSVWDGTSR